MLVLLALVACDPYARYEYLYQVGGVGAVEGSGRVEGVALVPRGLFVAEAGSAEVPVGVNTLTLATPVVMTRAGSVGDGIGVTGIDADNDWVAAVGSSGGFLVATADPAAPELIFEGAIAQGVMFGVAVANGVAFAASYGADARSGTLHRVDLAGMAADLDDPSAWYTTADLDTPPEAVHVAEGTVWVVPQGNGGETEIRAFDVRDLAPVGALPWSPNRRGDVEGVLVHDGTLYATTSRALFTADVSSPPAAAWTEVELEGVGGVPTAVSEGVLWVAGPSGDVRLVDIDRLRARGTFEGVCPGAVLDLAVLGQTFYAACGSGGLRVYAETRDWDEDLP